MRTPEYVMSNKCLQRDVEETKMMKNKDFDQGVVIEAAHMLCVWLLLDKMSHLFNIIEQKVWEV